MVIGLTDIDLKKIQEYMNKAEKADILYCGSHDSEHFDFERCPACEKEEREFADEMKARQQREENESEEESLKI
jgi:hypothetical protein